MTDIARSRGEPPHQAPAFQPGAERLSLEALLRAVRKHWRAAAMTAALVAVAVMFYTVGQTKIYRVSATIQVDPNPPRPLGKDVQTVVDMGAGDWFATREYLETQYKIIQSRRIATAVVQRLDLNHDGAFIANEAARPMRASEAVTVDVAVDALRSRLTVEPVKDSRLANVRYEDASPERAQRVLSAIIDTYISQNLDDTLLSVNSAVEWLGGQLDKLKTDLDSSEMALHEFKEQKNVLALEVDDQSNTLREQLRQLSAALTVARARHNELAAKHNELVKVPSDDPQNLSAPELLTNPLLIGLRQRYEDAVRERDEQLGKGKGRNHVDVRTADAAVTAARAAVLAEVRNVKGAADHELAAAEKQEGGLQALLAEAQRRALEVSLLEIQYNSLRRARQNNEKLYSMVLERTKETDLQRMLRVNNIRVLDPPDLPLTPVKPKLAIMIALAILGGMAAGLGVAVSLVALDRTIKTPDDLEAELGVTCLGILPALDESKGYGYGSKRRRGRARPAGKLTPELVVHEAPMSNVAEAARAVRTNLMFMSADDPIRALLVTSASPSEGKTTVACCMAIAIADAGHRTLLVDCDLRRPRIHRVFGKTGDEGLTTVLLDASALDRVIQSTEIPNLSILAAGPLAPNPADLMHSERFRALIAELRNRYDRVIFDSSPVSPVTDATILSAYVDATMLVVRAFVTKKDLARRTLRSIADVGSNIAGVVLNAVDFTRHEYRYASYYGRYGYGTPYGETKRTKHWRPRPSRTRPRGAWRDLGICFSLILP